MSLNPPAKAQDACKEVNNKVRCQFRVYIQINWSLNKAFRVRLQESVRLWRYLDQRGYCIRDNIKKGGVIFESAMNFIYNF